MIEDQYWPGANVMNPVLSYYCVFKMQWICTCFGSLNGDSFFPKIFLQRPSRVWSPLRERLIILFWTGPDPINEKSSVIYSTLNFDPSESLNTVTWLLWLVQIFSVAKSSINYAGILLIGSGPGAWSGNLFRLHWRRKILWMVFLNLMETWFDTSSKRSSCGPINKGDLIINLMDLGSIAAWSWII